MVADELAKESADADGGQMAAARASAIERLREEVCASIEFCDAHVHVHIKECKDGDEMVPG